MTPKTGQRRQTKEGLDAILSPRSVAVVGASPKQGSIGNGLLRSILDGGFKGPVFPIHPSAASVCDVQAYRSILDVPMVPDLAVIAVPATAVLEVVDACGRRGVKGLLVVTAGFRESDEEGGRREEQLRALVQRYGMRMVGPNCLGVVNASPSVSLHATFAQRPLLPGTTAMVTQSGAVGIALMEHASHVGLGISRFVSMGNKTDVSGNDLLLLWENDPEVRQVLLYLENLGNPRNFVEIARRVARRKPLVVIKSGRTATGAKAAGSHTGAMLQDDALVDALLEQCGVLRAQGVQEMFDVALALDSQPPLAGPRIAIVTNSGGPAILAVDALAPAGLRLAEPGSTTWDRLAGLIPAESHAANPLDLLAGGTPAAFEGAIRAVLDDDGVDGVLAIWTPLGSDQSAQAEAIGAAAKGSRKPVLAVTFGHDGDSPAVLALRRAHVPTYSFPESAVTSLGALLKVGTWRARGDEAPARVAVDVGEARRLLAGSKPLAGGWLSMQDAFRLLSLYGIPVPGHAFVANPNEAVAAAKEIGFPVVLKFDVSGVVHKTEAGAVRLGIRDEAALREAYGQAAGSLAQRGLAPASCVVMATIASAPEVLVGAVQDPLFGPIVACGTGGIYTEILRDVRFALAPLSRPGAKRMVAALGSQPILAGARGAAPGDVEALEQALTCIAQLVADLDDVAELDINPVRVLPRGQGIVAVDVRVRLRASKRP